jgi:hypothetical protein
MVEEKLESVTLKAPHYIGGQIRQKGEVVLVPEAIAVALRGNTIEEHEAAEAAKAYAPANKPKDADK